MNTKKTLSNSHSGNRHGGSRAVRSGAFLTGAVVAAIVAGNSVINAEPKGGVAVEGAGGLIEPILTEGLVTTIRNLDGTIIEWDSFQIQQGETTQFLQGSNSRVLNRVTGNLLSTEIHGLLKSDGRVFLVDPNGILVGQSGRIDTNGLVLSTLDISNDDFTNNKLNFRGGGGSVTNDGTIVTDSDALLVGGNVTNNNRISANGHVVLAAGDDVFISGNLKDGVTVTTNGSGRVINAGEIESAIVGLIGATVENSQGDEATEIKISEDGEIVLVANDGNDDGGGTTDGQQGTTDGTETDGTETDGTDTDGTGTDGNGTDGTDTDGTDTDGTDTDGSEGTDGTDGSEGTDDDGVATGDPVVPPTQDQDEPATGEEVTEETQVAAVNLVNSNESTVTEAEGASETVASEEDDESEEGIEVAIASDTDSAKTGEATDSKPGLCR